MATIFVRHKVDDFAAWKRVYDDFGSYRQANGVTGASVHVDPSDSNLVTVVHHFADVPTAKNFLDSQDLRSAMKNAGVNGQPEIWIGDDIERTAH